MLIVKYGIRNKDSTGYSIHTEKLESSEYYELMDSINALIISKLKKMKKVNYNDSIMIDTYFYI